MTGFSSIEAVWFSLTPYYTTQRSCGFAASSSGCRYLLPDEEKRLAAASSAFSGAVKSE
ncbi:hypothetical protein [Agrobacterium vitis]|uniref:hypothetical protein n=1 Tax=Agrobacterium vitis TaxID=373 RepID=UPI0015D69975|nr:hypothetical protein [Agrobacterium vitis]